MAISRMQNPQQLQGIGSLRQPYGLGKLVKKAFRGLKKVVKKLRIRNYPSLALFHNGSKKKVWKADMDGVVDVTNKHIKKSIEDALAGDVF